MASSDPRDSKNFLDALPPRDSKSRRSLGNLFGLKKTKSVSSSSSTVHAEQPPPYQAYDTGPAFKPTEAPREAPRAAETQDGRYGFLREYDTVFLIDDSGSMLGNGWSEAERALKAIAPTCAEYDSDGIDIEFLNHPQHYSKITNPEEIERIFQQVTPTARTPTGRRLRDLFHNYEERYVSAGSWDDVKPQNIIVITDGGATDSSDTRLEVVIQDFAKKLDKWDAHATQLGVQFFQIGDFPDATEMLQRLDDHLWGRDIVDTVKYTGRPLDSSQILKVVGGAVSKKLDGQTFQQIRLERKEKEKARASAERT